MTGKHRLSRLLAGLLQAMAVLLWVLPVPSGALPALRPFASQPPPDWLQQKLPGSQPDLLGGLVLPVQSTGGPGPKVGGSSRGDYGEAGPMAISRSATAEIIDRLVAARTFCSYIPWEYHIDCLRYYFGQIALSLPGTGDYAAVRDALASANLRLERVVNRYMDPAGTLIVPRLRSKPDAPRIGPLTPILAQNRTAANRAAATVIDETTTILLRSSSGSERRQIAFQQIATALDSSKVLLRSA